MEITTKRVFLWEIVVLLAILTACHGRTEIFKHFLNATIDWLTDGRENAVVLAMIDERCALFLSLQEIPYYISNVWP